MHEIDNWSTEELEAERDRLYVEIEFLEQRLDEIEDELFNRE